MPSATVATEGPAADSTTAGNAPEGEGEPNPEAVGADGQDPQASAPGEGAEGEENQTGEEEAATEGDGNDENPDATEVIPKNFVPQARFDEIYAQRGDALRQVEAQSAELASLRASSAEHTDLKRAVKAMFDVAKFDTRMREALNHWAVQGREPRPDEIEDPVQFANWRAMQERARFEEEMAQTKNAESGENAASSQLVDRFKGEESEMTKDPVIGKFVNNKTLAEAWSALADDYEAAKVFGRKPRFETLKQALVATLGEKVLTATANKAKQDVVKNLQKPAKILSGKNRAAGSSSAKPASQMTDMERIRATIERLEAAS